MTLPATITPFDVVRGYEDLHACRAAAIIGERPAQSGVDLAVLRAEWTRRYPGATDSQLAQGLTVLETLGVLVRVAEPAVVVDPATLARLAGNLAIMECRRRPLPRSEWAESPYVPAALRPLQRALARMHTTLPDRSPTTYHPKFWAFYPDVVAATER